MNPSIIAALIGLGGVFFGAYLNVILPDSPLYYLLTKTKRRNNLRGVWLSEWGPLSESMTKFNEDLEIYRQRGSDIWARASRHEEPTKKWEVKGRFDGQFLEMYYYPSNKAKNIDFIDYGCYFVQRKADGSFEGFSVGFGKFDEGPGEGITTDFHKMKRKL